MSKVPGSYAGLAFLDEASPAAIRINIDKGIHMLEKLVIFSFLGLLFILPGYQNRQKIKFCY